MTTFWLGAALLVLLCMVVLLRPLLRGAAPVRDVDAVPASEVYRDQVHELDGDLRRGTLDASQRHAAQDELGRRLLDDGAASPSAGAGAGASQGKGARRSPLLAALLLAAVPSAAILLYLQLGNPLALWRPGDMGPMAKEGMGHELSNAQVEGLVNQLAQRLRAQPDDAEGWYMLGRSYAALERPADAAVAYAKAVELVPDEAMVRADYADVLASVNGGSLQGPAQVQIDRALALDPDQPKALALAASAAMERGDKAQAVVHWEHLLALLPPQSQTAARIAASLAEARGETPVPVAGAAAASVAGRVAISDKVARKPAPDETVFIYARPVDGSRMPLAVLRRQVRDLPLNFKLDDSLAMDAGHRLSSQQSVMLEARISASGNAISQPGDLVGKAGPVPLGSSAIDISIDSMLPPAGSKP
ncbi:MAG: c-type cytochrome biogenesis protein CcmI [Proteobacteria bacterium]|nr:c-type cytochrome biogenesis protein CcmI [Pseudomonadota bacterium]